MKTLTSIIEVILAIVFAVSIVLLTAEAQTFEAQVWHSFTCLAVAALSGEGIHLIGTTKKEQE